MIPKNVQYDVYFDCIKAADGTADTTTAPTVERSLDGGNYAASTNSATRIQSTHTFKLTLTTTEMNTSCTIVKVTGAGLVPRVIYIYPEATWLSAVAAHVNADITSRSSHSAADIWAVATRALTDKALFTLHSDYDPAKTAASQTSVNAIDTIVDTIVGDLNNGGRLDLLIDAIKAKTDTYVVPPTTAEIKTALEIAGGSLALILADTGGLQADWVNGGRLDLLIDAIKAKTDVTALDSTVAKDSTVMKAAGYTAPDNTGIGNALAQATEANNHAHSIETKIDIVDGVADSIKLKTDLIPGSPAAVGSAMTLQAGHGLALDSTVAKDATVSKLTAPQVWEYTTRSLSTFGTLLADIWAYATRTLTSGGSLTAQQTRDALKLAPTAGAAATDSIDDKLDVLETKSDTIDTVVDAIKVKTDPMTYTVANKLDATADVAMSEQNITDIAEGVAAAISGGGTILYTDSIEYSVGVALPGVEVHCCSDSLGQSIIASTFTDDLGVFSFYLSPVNNDLPAPNTSGHYWIAVQHPQCQGVLTPIVVTA